MNNYEDEATLCQNPDNEATQYENTAAEPTNRETASINNEDREVNTAKSGTWKRAAVGAGAGLLVGGVASSLMGMTTAPDVSDDNSGDEEESGNHKEELSNPDWVDDDINVATCVNGDMSFGEAFAAARAEVGPGGCFEWHGNVYGTYTAEEWSHMTAEERADWSDHFSWNHIDHSHSHVAQHSTTAQHSTSNATAQDPVSEDDIEVVSVNNIEDNTVAQAQPHDNTPQPPTELEVHAGEPEIEILGVVHDDEADANVAGMTIDGQDVIIIDVDNDLAFDYMVSDINGDGQLDENEIVDIQAQNLTVNDLGGFTNPADDVYANNDAPDYTSDNVYEV